MEKVRGFRCVRCEEELAPEEAAYQCPRCGGNLQVSYNYDSIRRSFDKRGLSANRDLSIWRYSPLLPVEEPPRRPAVRIGWTPLYRAERLGRKLGLPELYLKDEGRHPSASFKDRASAVVVAKALERGERVITGASTGNAASSLACLTAALGLRTIIFVPRSAPAAKITQLLVFGAAVIAVKGSYDQAFDLCLKATEEYGWYNRNTGYNPYTREGKKTCAYELCEQLEWEPPDKIFVPVGDGNIISGLWKGFIDLHEIGFIERLPQLIACQAEGSDAVKRAFESDGVIRPSAGRTVADSISVGLPRDGEAAVKAIRESGGFALAVSDQEILAAIPELAQGTSVFGEPAGVASYAALKKAASLGRLKEEERIMLLMTGSGLKDIDSARKSVARPIEIEPDLNALKKIIAGGLV